MLLKDKVAVIYGGGGVIGGAVARAFARAGARVFLAGRTQAKLDAIAKSIRDDGGQVETAQVDALDSAAVEAHADAVAARAGRIDITFNAVGVAHVQGIPLAQLSLDDYWYPVSVYAQTYFITAKAMARHMAKQGSGVILMLTTPVSKMTGPGYLGHSVACAGIEALSRHMAGELGAQGIRVLCIRSHAIPETVGKGSHAEKVFGVTAAREGMTIDAMLAGAASGTLLKRLPSLDDVANTALFLASDHASAMTGTVANLSCGIILD